MWKLERESEGGGGQLYYFLSNAEYVVGRKNCLILIEDDQSISRSHATFSVNHPHSSLGHPDIVPVLSVKDSSKYGTVVNGEKMESATSRNLKSGDKITFGVYNSKFRVVYEPLVVCSSCLSITEKSSLNQALQLLGGHVVNNWTENCTHLVMTSVKVTIKTICALICCKSIVKPEYFSEIIKAIKEKRSLPEPTSFVPIIDEPSLQTDSLDLSENIKRKLIFKDHIFLFLTAKQHKKLSSAVHFGGGKAQLLVGEWEDKHLLENPKTLVIDVGATESQLSESQTPTWVTSIMNILQGKGLRAIPEAEIGLAVIYMSTEIYCNPQQRAGNRNETGKATKSNIIGSSFSSSMAVNETIMPVSTFNTTAYVADTEPQDQTHNWVDISGAQAVKETPKSSRSHNSTKSAMSVDHDLESSSSGDSRSALFQKQLKPTEKKSQPIISEKPASQKAKTSQKMVSSKMLDYFQPTAKKRDRGVDEGELSTAKIARVENSVSRGSNPGKNISSVKQKDLDILSSNDMDLDTEPNVVSKEKTDVSDRWLKGNNDASMSGTVKDASMKRKQPDDDVVEESDVENDEISDQVEKKIPKTDPVMVKRQRLDSGNSGEDLKALLSGNSIRITQREQKIKTEPTVKQEPESPCEDKKTMMMMVHPKKENDDNLPNRVLLTEFRTLVVSRPAGCSQYTTNAKQRNGSNFKKFKKTAYPGAGSFPHIIGGSDLIAHDKKKNSELEQWLRQEMEEQTQQAREQSLAEDLFRYNPKNMKKRR